MKTNSLNSKTISLFWQFTKPDKLLFWLSTIGAGLGVLIQDVLPPLIVSKAFNLLHNSYATGQQVTFASLQQYVLFYIALVAIGFVVWRLQVFITWEYQIRSNNRIADRIFDHLQRQGKKFRSSKSVMGTSVSSKMARFIFGN